MRCEAAAGIAAAPRVRVFPKAVLWDIDGTLVESTRLGFDSTNAVLTKNGYPEISEANYKEGTRYVTSERFGFHVSGDPKDPAGPELAKQFDDLYVTLVSPDTTPMFPGLMDLIAFLSSSGCRAGALSNACTAYVRAVLAAHGLSEQFELQLGTDDVPAGKPSPLGLLQACKAMGVDPTDCVYVGDAPTDGRAAAGAGMPGVGVSWGSHAPGGLAEAFEEVVDSTADLQAALLRGLPC